MRHHRKLVLTLSSLRVQLHCELLFRFASTPRLSPLPPSPGRTALAATLPAAVAGRAPTTEPQPASARLGQFSFLRAGSVCSTWLRLYGSYRGSGRIVLFQLGRWRDAYTPTIFQHWFQQPGSISNILSASKAIWSLPGILSLRPSSRHDLGWLWRGFHPDGWGETS